MRSADQDADVFRGKVSIISTVDCPPIKRSTVQVLFARDGAEYLRTIVVQRPTYFDQLCTVVVKATSSPWTWQPQPIRSVKDVLRNLYWRALDADKKYGAPLRFDKPIFDTRAFSSPNNFSHLLLDIIPLCIHARHCIGSDVSFAFGKLGIRFREILSVFAIDPIVTHKRIVGPIVHIHGTRGLAPFNVDAFDCNAITFFPNTYRQYDIETTVKYDKVFVARRGVRAIINQSDIERLLTAHGYTTVYMEDFSILDQMSIAAHARHVVAIHGGAIAFFALNRGINSFIELFPPHVYHALYPVALGAQVQKYIVVIQEFDERIIHNGWDALLHFKYRSFEVNLRLLERALADVERSAKVERIRKS